MPQQVAEDEFDELDPWGLFSVTSRVTRDGDGQLVCAPVFPLPSIAALYAARTNDDPEMMVAELFEPPLMLAPPEEIDDEMLGAFLKAVIARLAQHQVQVVACEHVTERQIYAGLIERHLFDLASEVEPIDDKYPEQVLVLSLHESCPVCVEETRKLLDDIGCG
jgi:hypothetical protein